MISIVFQGHVKPFYGEGRQIQHGQTYIRNISPATERQDASFDVLHDSWVLDADDLFTGYYEPWHKVNCC